MASKIGGPEFVPRGVSKEYYLTLLERLCLKMLIFSSQGLLFEMGDILELS